MDLWQTLQKNEGKTMHTLYQNKPFKILKVADHTCTIAVPTVDHNAYRERVISKEHLLPLYEQLVRDGELDIQSIKKVYTFNSSYASALLASLEGVTFTTRPIHLQMRA
jgi:hypothetical protein